MSQDKIRTEAVDEMLKVFARMNDTDELYSLLQDLCTVREIADMAQRLQVAKLLSKKNTYNEIEKQTHASTATISRINKCLVYGADGYRRVLERLEKEE